MARAWCSSATDWRTNEPVFSSRTGLEDRLAEVQEVFELIDPGAYFARHPMLDAAVSSCPIPGQTTATGLRRTHQRPRGGRGTLWIPGHHEHVGVAPS